MRLELAMLLFVMIGCAQDPPAAPVPETATAPAPAPAPVVEGTRVILPNGTVIRVEIAADDEMRAQGLMYRAELPPNTGMLFFFPQDGDYPFWMKNTVIPLDMIWVDKDKKIVHVKHNVPPCKTAECPNYPPHVIARYVLELAAGEAKKHDLKAGDLLQFEGMERVVVR